MRNGLLILALVLTTVPTEAQLFRPRQNCAPVAPLWCPPLSETTPSTSPMTNPDPMANQNLPPNLENAFASANARGGTSAQSFNDGAIFGDFGGYCAVRRSPLATNNNTGIGGGNALFSSVCVPLGGRFNGIFLTDNDGPRPTDRVYFGYNYYDRFGIGLNGDNIVTAQRQTIGFEKTVLDGDASFGMRLPFIQVDGPFDTNQRTVGDLSLMFKYAYYNNRDTGDLGSAGMILTLPTGQNDFRLDDGSAAPEAVIFQPWIGGIRTVGRGYVQGVSSFLYSLDSREPMMFNNTLSAGWSLFRNPADRIVQGVTPTFEVHVRTPLTNRDPTQQIFFLDQVNLTGGVHLQMMGATISPAINIPVAGPRLWNYEAMIWVTFKF